MSDLSKVQKMNRKELIGFCEKNDIPFRIKDGTEDIRKKIIKSLGTVVEAKKPEPKKPESKKEVPVQKKTEKKTPEKKAEKASAKEPVIKQDEKYNVKLRQIGQNMIIVIDGKQHSRVEPDAAQREAIKQLVASINKKRTKPDTDKLMSIFDGKKANVNKETGEVDIKALAASVSALTVQMEQLTKIVADSMKTSESAPKTEAPKSTRNGEKPYI